MRSVKEWKDQLIDETMSCDLGEARAYMNRIIHELPYGWNCTNAFKDRENRKKAAREILDSLK